MEDSHLYHIGIILDGNGRWARAQSRPRLFGHNAGFKNVRKITDAALETEQISVLTLYAFAIANWKRDKEEVDGLWNIFRTFFEVEFKYMMEQGCHCTMIGARDRIPDDIMQMIEDAEEKSKHNTRMTVQIALNYDGVDEVVRATRELVMRAHKGEIGVDEIDETMLTQTLDTGEQQAPDVIIRTGMSQVENETGMAIWRSSSFLQLQSSQSVCVSTPVLWPDFSPEDLEAAITFADPGGRLFGGQRKS